MTYTHGPIQWGFSFEKKGVTQPLFSQVHGNDLVEVNDPQKMRLKPSRADGGFTYLKKIELSVFTADCFPLLFFSDDPNGPIAAVHCGWRGALSGIARTTAARLGFVGGDYHLVIGPGILSCCFEVQEDFIQAFHLRGRPIDKFLERGDQTVCHLDRFILEEDLKDLPPKKIHAEMKKCTVCSKPEMPSYRRNKGTDPRIRTWIRVNQ